MLPSRKKKFMVIFLATLFFTFVVLGIYFLTKYIKSDKTVKLQSDAYPSEIVYMGIKYDKDNGYEKIIPLKSDFSASDYVVNSFFSIKDAKVIQNRLMIYSDAVNEVAYKSAENTFFLNEINSFYSTEVDVKLAKDYIVFIKADNSIEYRRYEEKQDVANTVLATNLTSKSIYVRGNVVYYRDFEGIVAYNLETGVRTVLIPVDDNFSPYIEEGNDFYLLIRNNKDYFVYSIDKGKKTYFKDAITEESYKYLTLYETGFVYARLEPYAIVGYSAFFNRKEYSPYKIKENFQVENMFFIDKSICYVDIVSYQEKEVHEYFIIDLEDNEILTTLDEPFEKIIKVG